MKYSKYRESGSALILVIMIVSTCALYLRCIIRNARYSVQYAQLRTKHIHDSYILLGFNTLTHSWVADNNDRLIRDLQEGDQENIELYWPCTNRYRAHAIITKTKSGYTIIVENEAGKKITSKMEPTQDNDKQYTISTLTNC